MLSASGCEAEVFWNNLAAGRSALGPLTRIGEQPYPAKLVTRVAAEIRDFDPASEFGKEGDLLDRFAQFGVICGRRALADAGLPTHASEGWPYAAERVGVLTGTGMGGICTQDQGFRTIYGAGATRVHPFLIPRTMYSAATSQIGMMTGARGPSFTISTACSSSTHALGEAWRLLGSGAVDMMIAGGSDAPLTFGVIKAWEAMRVLANAGEDASRACRPFSRDRGGLVLGEGAAMFVLERASAARQRGARIYGELAGYGASADAGHITQPSREGAASAMREAMRTAGLAPGDVDYINAHGTGTVLNDRAEAAAIGHVFGSRAAQVAVSSTKAMTGHLIAAASAVEAVLTVLGLEDGFIPASLNFQTPDPECPLDVVAGAGRHVPVRLALSNGFGFGGQNACVVLARA